MSRPTPDLPVLPAEDSMLSRRFGREVANYFSGSPLNRVSFLRTDHVFLRRAFAHPSATFLLLESLAPLTAASDGSRLAYATGAEVQPLTGADPFAKTEEEMIRDFNSEETRPAILFLGVDDQGRLPHRDDGGSPFEYKKYRGSPYFAVDVTPRGSTADAANGVIAAVEAKGLSFFREPRHMGLGAAEGTPPRPSETSRVSMY